jgi:cysteine synthase
MIDRTIDRAQRERTARRCGERGILIPTFAQMKDPTLIPGSVKGELGKIGLWDLHPRNLFRITWKNEPVPRGGGFGGVNAVCLPPELTGIEARVVALVGKWFPTGAHKVGATFGCIVTPLVTGRFDPASRKAVWPSTGNFCRGGAYVSSLLGCRSVAVLPEGMSRERFEWLASVAGEVIATPGSESNVKEIFDKCRELVAARRDITIFNQFEEFGNYLWHYEVTGSAMEEALRMELGEGERFAGVVLSSGSAGTLGCGDYLKEAFPRSRVAAGEALQCPTLLMNGYGSHRIEGIGDKHVPWIHNVRNTDVVIGVDDEHALRLLRLFNEPAGRGYLRKRGVTEETASKLDLLGISSVGNLIAAVKFARYFELGASDVVATVFTDSLELYGSRLGELERARGPYGEVDAVRDFEMLRGLGTDHVLELSHYDRKRIHNLKYYTWVEQMGKPVQELDAQWRDHERYWGRARGLAGEIDALIEEFNGMAAR